MVVVRYAQGPNARSSERTIPKYVHSGYKRLRNEYVGLKGILRHGAAIALEQITHYRPLFLE